MPASAQETVTADRIDRLPVRPAVRDALRTARMELARFYGPRLQRLVLFGSQARGEAQEDSDVDVLVVLQDPVDKHAELGKVSEIGWQLVLETGELVGFVVTGASRFAEATTPLLRTVRSEGVEL